MIYDLDKENLNTNGVTILSTYSIILLGAHLHSVNNRESDNILRKPINYYLFIYPMTTTKFKH